MEKHLLLCQQRFELYGRIARTVEFLIIYSKDLP